MLLQVISRTVSTGYQPYCFCRLSAVLLLQVISRITSTSYQPYCFCRLSAVLLLQVISRITSAGYQPSYFYRLSAVVFFNKVWNECTAYRLYSIISLVHSKLLRIRTRPALGRRRQARGWPQVRPRQAGYDQV